MTFRNNMNWTIYICVVKDGVVVCFQLYESQIDCLATPADVNWEIRTKVNPSQKKRRLNRLNTLQNPQILSISYPTPRGMCLSIISFVSSWMNEAKTIFLLYLIWKKCIFDHVLQYMMQFSNSSSVLMFRSYHKIWQKKLLSILFQSLTILQCLVGWNINCLNIYSSLS